MMLNHLGNMGGSTGEELCRKNMHRRLHPDRNELRRNGRFLQGFVFGERFFGHLIFATISLSDIISRHVSDIGDVFDMAYFVTGAEQHTPERVRENESSEIADMGIVIHGEAAGIHADLAFFSGNEFFFGFREGIIELHRWELSGVS
jgi:hypothetical protein